MRRIYGLAALAAAVTLATGAAQAQQKVVIGIPTSPPNVVHMPAIVAKDLGLYKKEGLDVEIVSLGDGTKVYRALLAGNIDFGLTPGATNLIGTLQRRDGEGADLQPAQISKPRWSCGPTSRRWPISRASASASRSPAASPTS